MTKVHIRGPASTAGKTDWEPAHTQQQRDKQDVSLKTLPMSDTHTSLNKGTIFQIKKGESFVWSS